MEAKAFEIKKQVYFWFDDKGGFMVYQLEKPRDKQGGIYLINVGGKKDQIFSFGGLQNEAEIYSENEIRMNILLPDQDGVLDHVISKYRFDQLISLFKTNFGEK